MSNTLTLTLESLHPVQMQIKNAARRFNVVSCGRRFGKTKLGIDLAIEPALRGFPVGWFAPDHKTVLEVWREMSEVLHPVIARPRWQEKRLELVTGGVIEFWDLDRDPEKCRSRKYKRIIVDEAAKVRQLARAWSAAIRATLMDYEGDGWFFSTPRGRDDYWTLWQKGDSSNVRRDPDWQSWQMPSYANPFLKPSEIEAMRTEVGPRLASQEIDAVFLEVAGRYFDEYDADVHAIWSFPVPAHWHHFGGFDWGKAAPCAFGLSVSDERGNVTTIDEVYEASLSNDEQAIAILRCLERNHKDPSDVFIAADPSIFPPAKESERIGRYTVEDFWKHGLRMVPASNNRVVGWTRWKEYMRYREPETGQPGWRIFKDKCPNGVRTIPLMVASERNPEDLDTTQEDHWCDGPGRYALMSRPPRSAAPAVPAVHLQYRAPDGTLRDSIPMARDSASLPHALRSNRPEESSYE